MFPLFLAVVLSAALPGPSPVALPFPPYASVATTQPANTTALEQMDVDESSIAQIFGNTRIGELFRGKKKVTLADVRDPAFWIDTVRDLILAVFTFIPRIIVAGMFLIFFWAIYRAVRRVVLASMTKAHVDPSIRDMLGHLLKWSIMGFGIVIACNQIGVQIAALLTGVSIIGLAIGFAAQETLANFIAGIVIFWDKPFKVGDWLELDSTYGQVQRVTFRSTRILDTNGQLIVYPNTHMLSNRVSNHTTFPATRVGVPIGIAYKESIDDARAAMLSTVEGDDRVSRSPEPNVVVAACSDSSVNLLLRFWISDPSLERVIVTEYVEKCKKALDAAGIAIPFPHMQVFVEDTPAVSRLAGSALRKVG
jgi:small conductance mechanosensitive channel